MENQNQLEIKGIQAVTLLNTISSFEAGDVLRGCCSQGCCPGGF